MYVDTGKLACNHRQFRTQGDGDADHPVISVSIGASCNFGWRPAPLPPAVAAADTAAGSASVGAVEQSPNRSVVLASGDVVIFGGVSRMMEHAVKSVHSVSSAPVALQQPHALGGGRLNFTFRHAPIDTGGVNVHTRR